MENQGFSIAESLVAPEDRSCRRLLHSAKLLDGWNQPTASALAHAFIFTSNSCRKIIAVNISIQGQSHEFPAFFHGGVGHSHHFHRPQGRRKRRNRHRAAPCAATSAGRRRGCISGSPGDGLGVTVGHRVTVEGESPSNMDWPTWE